MEKLNEINIAKLNKKKAENSKEYSNLNTEDSSINAKKRNLKSPKSFCKVLDLSNSSTNDTNLESNGYKKKEKRKVKSTKLKKSIIFIESFEQEQYKIHNVLKNLEPKKHKEINIESIKEIKINNIYYKITKQPEVTKARIT